MKNILFIILMPFIFIACGGGGSEATSSETTKSTTSDISNSSNVTPVTIKDSLRGEWMYINDGTIVYIDENFVYPITEQSSTLISIVKDSKTYHLMRSGIDSTNVNGNLYEEGTVVSKSIARAIGRNIKKSQNKIGNINVILKHLTDAKNKKEQNINTAGQFSFSNVKSGKYVLKATTDTNLSVETKVDVKGEEISLGSFKLVGDDGYNFKTEFVIDNSDSGYFYGNLTTYTGKLKIKNIGTKLGTGLNYTFKTDSGYVANLTNEIILGTVDVNQSIDIPFSISFNVLDKVTETVSLDIIIKDVNNNEWIDTVFFHVYQTPMNVYVKSKQANVNGYIVAPGNELTKINASNATLTVPYRAGKVYYLVLSNPDVQNETPYSIGIDVPTLAFDTFQETGAHEPNNIESEATTIRPDESIVSYLHVGDIDYYKIDMSTSADVGLYSPPQIPFR
ncbi:hypothetical protein GJV85_01125 [Sulfurimonas aquatica]|uniref:Lipoprotein n=1 Tax=Sulfurimonas aquatica TaxID=2672570 RepID=A0A975GBK4_9BACT|nr:hypothetical protein [Sulfurimonas aquatica]QSZ40776.1 hypothetical protein GJV85_01125 [Sulfurimonas aquatica]